MSLIWVIPLLVLGCYIAAALTVLVYLTSERAQSKRDARQIRQQHEFNTAMMRRSTTVSRQSLRLVDGKPVRP